MEGFGPGRTLIRPWRWFREENSGENLKSNVGEQPVQWVEIQEVGVEGKIKCFNGRWQLVAAQRRGVLTPDAPA